MSDKVQRAIEAIGSRLPGLAGNRNASPLANDVYEAASYWLQLGKWFEEGNTKIEFPARAREEQALLEKLKAAAAADDAASRECTSLFDITSAMLADVSERKPPEEGHAGILEILKRTFGFLIRDHGFSIVSQYPLGARFSSGSVWFELRYAEITHNTCTFGPEADRSRIFWPEDILFLYRDDTYREIQEGFQLPHTADLERWFSQIATILFRYGGDIISGEPGIFDRLLEAQNARDHERNAILDENAVNGSPRKDWTD